MKQMCEWIGDHSTDNFQENQSWWEGACRLGFEGWIGVVWTRMGQGSSLCAGVQIHPPDLKEGLASLRIWAVLSKGTQQPVQGKDLYTTSRIHDVGLSPPLLYFIASSAFPVHPLVPGSCSQILYVLGTFSGVLPGFQISPAWQPKEHRKHPSFLGCLICHKTQSKPHSLACELLLLHI